MSIKCKICGSSVSRAFTSQILGKYRVSYSCCNDCGFLFAENPFWLDEAYSKPISASDTGILTRNYLNSRVTTALIRLCFDSKGVFVDYGGGYGLFVRMMRDKGFYFYRDDRYCSNLFANGFDRNDSCLKLFDLVTAFEVFEHFVSPLEELEKLLKISGNVFFSTEVLPVPPPSPDEWWYYGLDHGQHVAFYTRQALQQLAMRFNLAYYYSGNFHLFTDKKTCTFNIKFSLAMNRYMPVLMGLFMKDCSLAAIDNKAIAENISRQSNDDQN